MITFKSAHRILRKLPRENAFYFFTSIGNYTGVNADSLEEFVKKILDVNVKSLEFHLYRGDFEKWANKFFKMRNWRQTLEDCMDSICRVMPSAASFIPPFQDGSSG